jgi:hypothetical protein
MGIPRSGQPWQPGFLDQGRQTVGTTTSAVTCTCSYTWGIGLEQQPTEIRRPGLNCPIHPMPVTAGACPGCGTSISVLLIPGD